MRCTRKGEDMTAEPIISLKDFLTGTFTADFLVEAAAEYAAISRKGVEERRIAVGYAHEDGETRDYTFADEGRIWTGSESKTWCGHWFSICRDDPDYMDDVWRWSTEDDRPTCPLCLGILEHDEAE